VRPDAVDHQFRRDQVLEAASGFSREPFTRNTGVRCRPGSLFLVQLVASDEAGYVDIVPAVATTSEDDTELGSSTAARCLRRSSPWET
jgi:hypothetical protein